MVGFSKSCLCASSVRGLAPATSDFPVKKFINFVAGCGEDVPNSIKMSDHKVHSEHETKQRDAGQRKRPVSPFMIYILYFKPKDCISKQVKDNPFRT